MLLAGDVFWDSHRRHMHKGISVWLDVPVDALARRISAVGTHSRPLLHNESGDIYAKVYNLILKLHIWEWL